MFIKRHDDAADVLGDEVLSRVIPCDAADLRSAYARVFMLHSTRVVK